MIHSITKERLATFSDSIFAVIITVMVLQLRLPAHATFDTLFDEWPTALSYAVSYLLIVIMWINHHYLWSFAKQSTPRSILWNFVHMFSASLVPFATAWVAETRIAAVPVFVYSAVIVMVNLSYHAFAYEVIARGDDQNAAKALRQRSLTRSILTLVLFITAMLLSLEAPYLAFALVTCVLLNVRASRTSRVIPSVRRSRRRPGCRGSRRGAPARRPGPRAA